MSFLVKIKVDIVEMSRTKKIRAKYTRDKTYLVLHIDAVARNFLIADDENEFAWIKEEHCLYVQPNN